MDRGNQMKGFTDRKGATTPDPEKFYSIFHV